MGSQGGEDSWQSGGRRTWAGKTAAGGPGLAKQQPVEPEVPHFLADKLGGNETVCTGQGSSAGK